MVEPYISIRIKEYTVHIQYRICDMLCFVQPKDTRQNVTNMVIEYCIFKMTQYSMSLYFIVNFRQSNMM